MNMATSIAYLVSIHSIQNFVNDDVGTVRSALSSSDNDPQAGHLGDDKGVHVIEEGGREGGRGRRGHGLSLGGTSASGKGEVCPLVLACVCASVQYLSTTSAIAEPAVDIATSGCLGFHLVGCICAGATVFQT